MKEDTCVCCGQIVPEGTWVCENCWMKLEGKDNGEGRKK